MVFRIHVRVLQVAVANGHTAVERELRRFLKVRNAKYNNGVGYLYYGSKTTHFGVRGGGVGGRGCMPRCRRLVFKCLHTLFFIICFYTDSLYVPSMN